MFVRAPNPIWYLPDLTGLPLNDEYYAFFLTNTLPYIPQAVYRDNQGMTVWTNSVLQFYPNGTLPDNLYFDPNLVYRIEIRHGSSQTDALIYEINDFVPGPSNSIITNAVSILFAENQISNGNFSLVNFSATVLSPTVPTITITVAGTYEISPGWFLTLTGSGTTTLTQKIYSGSSAALEPNAINYGLNISSSGWSGVILYQRFNNNGNIFADGAINISFLGRAPSSAQSVSATYSPSDSGTPTTVINTSVLTGHYVTYSGTMNLPVQDNSDLSSVAYTDIIFTLPTTGAVEITDVQVVGQNTPLIDPATSMPYATQTLISTINPEYQQTTEERNLDHLFHYYADALIAQPKDSLLAGWNFPLNPWQFTTTAITNVANNGYHAADQTIMIQQAYVASTTANNIAVGQAINTNDFALQINAVTATNQFGIVQYIDTATIAPYWGKTLSAMVKAKITTINSSKIAMKMRLFSKLTVPGAVSQTDPVSAWVSGSDPVFAAGYTAIIPENDPIFILSDATEQTFSFNKFTLPSCSTDVQTLGIIFYSITDMSISGTPDIIFINDVSLVNNDFALPTQPQTFNQVLEDCQYYYEKSYDQYVLPTASTSIGCLNFVMFVATGGGFVNSKAWPFGFRFNTVKRDIPTLHLRSTTGVIDEVTITNRTNAVSRGTASVADTFWLPTPGTKGVSAIVVATADLLNVGDGGSTTAPTAEITFHYTADARIGK
jgi:hypothetical protein